MKPSEKTILEYLHDSALHQPDKRLLGDLSGWMTVSQVQEQVQQLAAALMQAGVAKGSCAAVRMERNAATVLMLLGLRMAGAIAVLTDSYTEPEVCLAGCETQIPVDFFISRVGEKRFLLRYKDTFTPISLGMEYMEKAPVFAAEANSQEPGYVIFTSGSTGKTKAVVLSDYNLVNNLVDSYPLGDYREDDIALGSLPIDHVFGLVLLVGAIVLHYGLYLSAHTDIPSILTSIEYEHITRMNGVPSLYLSMAAQCRDYDLSSLRCGFIGGAPATDGQLLQIETDLGIRLIPVYGMSECIGISCANAADPPERRNIGVGRFYSMNTGILLSEDNTPAAVGKIGEVCVKGPSRMWGYWGQKLADDQWFHTGDLGYLDADGILHLTGRKKELIIHNGRNISPKKIEDAILSLPGVLSAAVVGLPDEQAGETPYAMVCGIIDPAQLKPLLPKNELPAGIMCVEQMPMTVSGKPDKVQIREVLKRWRNG